MEQYARQAGLRDVEVVERPPYAFEYQSRRLYLSACKPSVDAWEQGDRKGRPRGVK